MKIKIIPIGIVKNRYKTISKKVHIRTKRSKIVLFPEYTEGFYRIKEHKYLEVIFHFHKSPKFTSEFMRIKPPIRDNKLGVFSTHSPFRPNPIGLSILEVIGVDRNVIQVKGLDMIDRTPILDIKPEICHN